VAYNTGMELALTVFAVFVILVASELWWQRHVVEEEFSRKFIHITVGSFVAFWPFYLSWGEIQLLSVAFLVVIILSKYLKLFEAIHSVQRPTWGEIFFAAAVGIVTLITQDQWIYAAALLQMSLADGLAAVIGIRFGGKYRYLVWGHTKSVIGTLTFLVVSLAILVTLNHHMPHMLGPAVLVLAAGLATIIENVAAQGLDNLLVPVLVALILTHS
jgi:phytol kinase